MPYPDSSEEELTIYSEFLEYANLDDTEPYDAKSLTIYAIDTNVLVDLFKFTRQTAEELLDALETMSDVLFVPHQALAEFWPLVEDGLKGNHHREALGKLQSHGESISQEIDRWLKGTGLSPERASDHDEESQAEPADTLSTILEARKAVSKAVQNLKEIIEEVQNESQDNRWILERLENILKGRIGKGPSDEECKALQRAFEERVSMGIPPGILDAKHKNPTKAGGDFFIWRQCIEESKRRQAADGKHFDLTLVTSDLKEDWTRSKDPVLARRTLVKEYAEEAGGMFRIRTFQQLIQIAEEHFGANVTASSRAQLDAVFTNEDDRTMDRAIRAYDLAHVASSRGDFRQAISILEQSLEDYDRALGPFHPETLVAREYLADAYKSAGEINNAIFLYRQAFHDHAMVFGPDHPSTMGIRKRLADSLYMSGDLLQAIALYEASLDDHMRVLGPNHQSTNTIRESLAKAYSETASITSVETSLSKTTDSLSPEE